MSVFVLKLIAMVSMALDHFGYVMLISGHTGGAYQLCRALGRIAFPIYAFLIVNGLQHSSDRRRYLFRLLCFALISQLPFVLAFSAGNYAPLSLAAPSLYFALPKGHGAMALIATALGAAALYRDMRLLPVGLALLLPFCSLRLGSLTLLASTVNTANIFYTLSLGLALLWLMEELSGRPRGKKLARLLLLGLFWLAAALLYAPLIDYGKHGILLIALLGLCRKSRLAQAAAIIAWGGYMYLPGSRLLFGGFLLALVPILLYNGRRGTAVKLGFYAFYPVHLLLLAVLGMAL